MDNATVPADCLMHYATTVENLAATLAAASNGIAATGDAEAVGHVMDGVANALQLLSDAMHRDAEASHTWPQRAA